MRTFTTSSSASRAAARPATVACKAFSALQVRKCAQSVLLATAAAGVLTLAPADRAEAISGGKESVGIFKPLDDQDLSGKDLRKLSFVKASLRRVNFDNANLAGTSMFGATCTDCSFVKADLRGTSIESANVEGADFSGANMEGALVANTQFGKNKIDNSDWTDVLPRRDTLKYLCGIAKGTHPDTGVSTRESLGCR